MNKKRIAAIIGLILIFVSIISIMLFSFIPQAKDLLVTINTVTFLSAAVIAALLLRRKEEEEAQAEKPADEDELTLE